MSYRRIEYLTESHRRELFQLYQLEWWSKNRTWDDVQVLIKSTDVFVAFEDSDTRQLVAFARVLTDGVYKAMVFDVIVHAEHRSRGLGRLVLNAIIGHPRLANVRDVELYCLPDLIDFYARLGFSADCGGVVLMRRRQGDADR